MKTLKCFESFLSSPTFRVVSGVLAFVFAISFIGHWNAPVSISGYLLISFAVLSFVFPSTRPKFPRHVQALLGTLFLALVLFFAAHALQIALDIPGPRPLFRSDKNLLKFFLMTASAVLLARRAFLCGLAAYVLFLAGPALQEFLQCIEGRIGLGLNPNTLARYCLFYLFPLMLFWETTTTRRPGKLFVALPVFACATIIVLSGSRNALLAVVSGCAVWFAVKLLFERKIAMKAFSLGLFVLLFSAVIPSGAVGRTFAIGTVDAENEISVENFARENAADRIPLWLGAWELIKKSNPICGAGVEQARFNSKGEQSGDKDAFFPHNTFLTAWAENGLLGLTAEVLLVSIPGLIAFLRLIKKNTRTELALSERSRLTILVAMSVSLTTYAMFDEFTIRELVLALPLFIIPFAEKRSSSQPPALPAENK